MAMPTDMTEIVEAYEMVIAAYNKEASTLTDEMLLEEVVVLVGQLRVENYCARSSTTKHITAVK